MINRLVAWAVFGVLIGVLPVFFTWLNAYQAASPGKAHDFFAVIATGDLILIAVVLIGATAGDLLISTMAPSERPTASRRIGLNTLAAVIAFALGLYFYENVVDKPEFYAAHHVGLYLVTFVLFGVALVVGASSIALRTLDDVDGSTFE